jgi:hypothetical protein
MNTEQLISAARGQNWILSKEITTYVPLWERMDEARPWTLQWLLGDWHTLPRLISFLVPWHTLPGLISSRVSGTPPPTLSMISSADPWPTPHNLIFSRAFGVDSPV